MDATWKIIWAGIALGVFLYAWRKGHLLAMSKYVAETKEELRKCAWPSKAELKGSTTVVMVSIVLFGFYTVLLDFVVREAIKAIM